jgi:hypothetical protein
MRHFTIAGALIALAPGTAAAETSGFLGCPVERMGNHEALLTVFGPSGGPFVPGLERSGPLEFVALDADERTPYERTEPLGSFGPYAAGGQQAQHLDVWITAVSLDSADPTWTVAVRVVASIRSDAGVRWWALRVPTDTAEGRISGKEPFRVDPVEGGPAAPPILIASFDTTAHGHTADIGTTVRLALDFRGATPRALAKLECSSSDTRQSCTGGWGFKDTDFWTGTSADCVWSVAQDGFRCRLSEYAGTDWGGRLWSSLIDLESGSLVSLPALKATHLLGLFSPIASGVSGGQRKARVADVGTLTWLATVEGRVKGRSLSLLAARGAGLGFDPRFFLLRIDAERTGAAEGVSLEELKVYDPDPRGPDADHELEPRLPAPTPDGEDPAFELIPAPDAPSDVHTFHVVATEGAGHGLYRVGIEDGAKTVAGAARLASDVAYPFCGGRTHPASAVRINTAEAGTLQLEMEPAYFDLGDARLVRETDGQRISRQCPWTARLRWQPGRGFVWEDDSASCERPAMPRHIEVRPDGRIEVVPLEAP